MESLNDRTWAAECGIPGAGTPRNPYFTNPARIEQPAIRRELVDHARKRLDQQGASLGRRRARLVCEQLDRDLVEIQPEINSPRPPAWLSPPVTCSISEPRSPIGNPLPGISTAGRQLRVQARDLTASGPAPSCHVPLGAGLTYVECDGLSEGPVASSR